MPLAHAIVHGISRAGINAPVKLQLAAQPLPLSGYLEELVKDLKHSYAAKGSKQYGQFTADLGRAQLAGWLRDFSEERMGFESFTHKCSEHFRSLLENIELELDGQLLFALEKLADADVLYLFVLQQSEGIYIDGDLTLQTNLTLDVTGIVLGAKVNLTDWLSGEGTYLSVLRSRGEKDLTDLFQALLGFAEPRDIAAETTEFLDIVRDYTANLPEEKAQECRTKVVDYCLTQDKLGEPVLLEELSQQINDSEPQEFVRFVADKQEVKRAELIPDRKQLRSFVRISGRNDDLSMSFSSECLGQSIMYDKQSDSLIITNIPGPLKLRLIEHMKAMQQGAAPQAETEG